jgi:hypothetical protein
MLGRTLEDVGVVELLGVILSLTVVVGLALLALPLISVVVLVVLWVMAASTGRERSPPLTPGPH